MREREKERERKRERQRENKRETETDRQTVTEGGKEKAAVYFPGSKIKGQK